MGSTFHILALDAVGEEFLPLRSLAMEPIALQLLCFKKEELHAGFLPNILHHSGGIVKNALSIHVNVAEIYFLTGGSHETQYTTTSLQHYCLDPKRICASYAVALFPDKNVQLLGNTCIKKMTIYSHFLFNLCIFRILLYTVLHVYPKPCYNQE